MKLRALQNPYNTISIFCLSSPQEINEAAPRQLMKHFQKKTPIYGKTLSPLIKPEIIISYFTI